MTPNPRSKYDDVAKELHAMARRLAELSDAGFSGSSAPTEIEIIEWMEANPEAIRSFSVNKSWGRKVWWTGPNGNYYDTLRECAGRAIKEYPLRERILNPHAKSP